MRIFTALMGILLIAAIMIAPISVAAESTQTCAVLIDFGNGKVAWADVPVTSGLDAQNATINATASLGLAVNVSGGLINGIGGYQAAWPNEVWNLWLWNETGNRWDMAQTGASAVNVSDYKAIAWSYAQYKDTTAFVPPAAPLATPDHRYPWASFRHDFMNTGSALNYNATNATLLWSKNLTNGAIDSPIVAANGSLYVVTGGVMNMTNFGYDTNSTLFCLNSSGAQVWSAPIGKGYQVASPLIYSGMVIVPSADGVVYAFDAKNGSALWSFNTSSSVSGVSSSPVAYRNQIIFGGGNGVLFSLYENGSQAWNLTIAPGIYSSSPAVYNGTIYIGGEDGKIHAINATGSSELWNVSLGGKVRGSPLLLPNEIVVSYSNYSGSSPETGGLAAVSYAGDLLWQTQTNHTPGSPALTSTGIASVSSDGLTLMSFDGKKLWATAMGSGFPGAAPTAINGTIFAVTNEAASKLYAVGDNGTIRWTSALNPAEFALSTATIADGVLYVSSDNGYIYAYALEAPSGNTTTPTSDSTVLFLGIGIVAVAAIAAAVLLMRRK